MFERVCFELSNRCPYNHDKCPLSLAKDVEVLPADVVTGMLYWLQDTKWTGKVAFHNYNEPLIDPRLYYFIERCSFPVQIWTNGFYLNQTVIDELIRLGVTEFSVSYYTPSEAKRLAALTYQPAKYSLHHSEHLDDRLLMYDKEPSFKGPCHWPEKNLLIHSDGRVGLCCFDWKRSRTFGNLLTEEPEVILKRRQLTVECLAKGEREGVCKRCKYGA